MSTGAQTSACGLRAADRLGPQLAVARDTVLWSLVRLTLRTLCPGSYASGEHMCTTGTCAHLFPSKGLRQQPRVITTRRFSLQTPTPRNALSDRARPCRGFPEDSEREQTTAWKRAWPLRSELVLEAALVDSWCLLAPQKTAVDWKRARHPHIRVDVKWRGRGQGNNRVGEGALLRHCFVPVYRA